MEGTLARLHAMGRAGVAAPLLKIQLLPADLPPPAHLQAILVTSARALPVLPPTYHSLPLLAVGAATASAARARGHLCVLSADGDAKDLLHLTQSQYLTQGEGAKAAAPSGAMPARGQLLLLSGVGEGKALAVSLAGQFSVAHRFVYAATPVTSLPPAVSQALLAPNQPLDAALFFSAATAEVFVTLAEAAGLRDTVSHVEALAISAPTARVLARLPWRAVRVASRPNQDELLALLR
jgi:uroporphyrinogen-III synthase